LKPALAVSGTLMAIIFFPLAYWTYNFREYKHFDWGYEIWGINPAVTAFFAVMGIIGLILLIIGLALPENKVAQKQYPLTSYPSYGEVQESNSQLIEKKIKKPSYCSNCGQLVEGNFCKWCGAKIR